uniref:ARAD1C30030p n=1 Tax=Blastobotrys adeninivorans TaxID=409370 RepID=A0A060T2B3_BLAAD
MLRLEPFTRMTGSRGSASEGLAIFPLKKPSIRFVEYGNFVGDGKKYIAVARSTVVEFYCTDSAESDDGIELVHTVPVYRHIRCMTKHSLVYQGQQVDWLAFVGSHNRLHVLAYLPIAKSFCVFDQRDEEYRFLDHQYYSPDPAPWIAATSHQFSTGDVWRVAVVCTNNCTVDIFIDPDNKVEIDEQAFIHSDSVREGWDRDGFLSYSVYNLFPRFYRRNLRPPPPNIQDFKFVPGSATPTLVLRVDNQTLDRSELWFYVLERLDNRFILSSVEPMAAPYGKIVPIPLQQVPNIDFEAPSGGIMYSAKVSVYFPPLSIDPTMGVSFYYNSMGQDIVLPLTKWSEYNYEGATIPLITGEMTVVSPPTRRRSGVLTDADHSMSSLNRNWDNFVGYIYAEDLPESGLTPIARDPNLQFKSRRFRSSTKGPLDSTTHWPSSGTRSKAQKLSVAQVHPYAGDSSGSESELEDVFPVEDGLIDDFYHRARRYDIPSLDFDGSQPLMDAIHCACFIDGGRFFYIDSAGNGYLVVFANEDIPTVIGLGKTHRASTVMHLSGTHFLLKGPYISPVICQIVMEGPLSGYIEDVYTFSDNIPPVTDFVKVDLESDLGKSSYLLVSANDSDTSDLWLARLGRSTIPDSLGQETISTNDDVSGIWVLERPTTREWIIFVSTRSSTAAYRNTGRKGLRKFEQFSTLDTESQSLLIASTTQQPMGVLQVTLNSIALLDSDFVVKGLQINACSLSNSGLLTAQNANTLVYYAQNNLEKVSEIECSSAISSLFCYNDELCVVGLWAGQVEVYSLPKLEKLYSESIIGHGFASSLFVSTSDIVFIGCANGEILTCKLNSDRSLSIGNSSVTRIGQEPVKLTTESQELILAHSDVPVLFNVNTGQFESRVFLERPENITSIASILNSPVIVYSVRDQDGSNKLLLQQIVHWKTEFEYKMLSLPYQVHSIRYVKDLDFFVTIETDPSYQMGAIRAYDRHTLTEIGVCDSAFPAGELPLCIDILEAKPRSGSTCPFEKLLIIGTSLPHNATESLAHDEGVIRLVGMSYTESKEVVFDLQAQIRRNAPVSAIENLQGSDSLDCDFAVSIGPRLQLGKVVDNGGNGFTIQLVPMPGYEEVFTPTLCTSIDSFNGTIALVDLGGSISIVLQQPEGTIPVIASSYLKDGFHVREAKLIPEHQACLATDDEGTVALYSYAEGDTLVPLSYFHLGEVVNRIIRIENGIHKGDMAMVTAEGSIYYVTSVQLGKYRARDIYHLLGYEHGDRISLPDTLMTYHMEYRAGPRRLDSLEDEYNFTLLDGDLLELAAPREPAIQALIESVRRL